MLRVVIALATLTLSLTAAPAMAQVQLASVDTTMEELLGEARGELLLASEHLDLAKLDYSFESLKEIDAWLEAVHKLNATEAGDRPCRQIADPGWTRAQYGDAGRALSW